MQHTKFQASQPSGSEEEVFFEYFSKCFYDLNIEPTGAGPWYLHLNKLGKDPWRMLHTEFKSSKPSRSEEEAFLSKYFSMYFYYLNLGPPGVRPS